MMYSGLGGQWPRIEVTIAHRQPRIATDQKNRSGSEVNPISITSGKMGSKFSKKFFRVFVADSVQL